jgi:hypothetical protein
LLHSAGAALASAAGGMSGNLLNYLEAAPLSVSL